MRVFLLFVFISFLSGTSWAQLKSGDKMPVNIVAKDIRGNDVNIFADLDAGKSVVLDFFATWCGPCWGFHNGGLLKQLHNEFGIDGTDQIRVYAIEADGSTTSADLRGQGSNTWGDWTADIPYAIIENHSFNTPMQIRAFPTLYVIRPDRSVFEVGIYRNNRQVWERALMPVSEIDVLYTTELEDRTFCTTSTFSQRPGFINMGSEVINDFDIEATFNDSVVTSSIDNPVGPFGTGRLVVARQTLSETTEISMKIKAINGETVDLPEFKAKWMKPWASGDFLTIKFTTDFYPGDTEWTILNNKNEVIYSASYREGNADNQGGGGPDANTTFEHRVDIEDQDISCLRMTVTSRRGRGLTQYNPAIHPVPGIEIYNSNGDLVKPKLNNEINFLSNNPGTISSSVNVFVAYDNTSSSKQWEDFVSVEMYPNPAFHTLYLNVEMQDNSKPVSVFISDVLGQTMWTSSDDVSHIDVSHLQSGMYFLNISSGEKLYSRRFMKM